MVPACFLGWSPSVLEVVASSQALSSLAVGDEPALFSPSHRLLEASPAKKQTAAEILKAALDIPAKKLAGKKEKDEKQTSAKASKPLPKCPAANGNADDGSRPSGKIRVEYTRSQVVAIKINGEGKRINKCFRFGVNKKYTTIEEAKLAGAKWFDPDVN